MNRFLQSLMKFFIDVKSTISRERGRTTSSISADLKGITIVLVIACIIAILLFAVLGIHDFVTGNGITSQTPPKPIFHEAFTVKKSDSNASSPMNPNSMGIFDINTWQCFKTPDHRRAVVLFSTATPDNKTAITYTVTPIHISSNSWASSVCIRYENEP